MIQGSDGNLWTAFEQVGSSNGSVIAMSPVNGAVVQNFSFHGANGSIPEAGVIQGADGKIYGTAIGGGTLSGGKAPSGTVWSLDAGLPAPSPAAAAFSPASGAVGSTVLIRGNNFIGTTAGPIAVTNAGGATESQANFTVR